MLITEDKTDDFDAALVAEHDPACRLCGHHGQVEVFNMGTQAIGSYFPYPDEDVPEAPLVLLQCRNCQLVQLSHGCDHAGIYDSGNYGYRSGQNPQMVKHLSAKAAELSNRLRPGDTVLDIGANDGTFLNEFPKSLNRIGFDPTSVQWAEFFPSDVSMNAKLFSADAYLGEGFPKARLITSLSMLYDLEDPVSFAKDIAECLTDDGLWHFEQCYLPTMLATTGYDTICHEHLTYYTLATVRVLLASVHMYVQHVELNDANGGSFAVTAAKNPKTRSVVVDPYGARLPSRGLDGGIFPSADSPDDGVVNPWRARARDRVSVADLIRFGDASLRHATELHDLIVELLRQGKTVAALGASTKGNTLLQYADLGDLIAGIGEVNPGKVGKVTPGTRIPIVDAADVLNCDYLLVLPWHFRESFETRYAEYLSYGGHLIFPLPEIVVV